MRVLTVALALVAIAGIAQADILVDFGEPEFVNGMPNATYYPTPSPDPFLGKYWNMGAMGGDGDANTVTVFNDLVDSAGNVLTGTSMSVTGFPTDGNKGLPGSVVYPQSASQDAVGCKHGEDPGIITISGLTEPEYTVRLFSSTNEDVSWYNDDTRRTDVTIGGVTKMIHCSGNTDYIESFYNVAPVGGSITVEVTGATPGGDATYSYGYLNVMELVVPEPATLSLLAIGGLVAIRRRR